MERKEKIQKLLKIAKSQIGKPYKYGAYLEADGDEEPKEFDCSSFIQYIFKKIGIKLDRSSISQAAADGQEINDVEGVETGDLIFFEGLRGHYNHNIFKNKKLYIGHVAVYSGNGNVVHATDNLSFSKIPGVIESPLSFLIDSSYNLVLIKRVVSDS